MNYYAGATRNIPDKDESRDASRAPALFLTLNLIAYVVSYRGWLVWRGLNCNDAPKILSSSDKDVTQAIRKYL